MEHNERIIDPEWADTLLGLRVTLPNHWWIDIGNGAEAKYDLGGNT